MPIQEHPESILYNYLTTPRNNVPRWYLEGSAVFFETWMAGGLGRGQGAYDEMVFRAKVRDDDKLYSPLGLESEGIAIDFQVGVNDYLYGTRFFSWLALTYGPDKVVAMAPARRGQRSLLRDPVPSRVRQAARRCLARVARLGARVPARQPRQAFRLSADRSEASQPARAWVDVARLCRRADQPAWWPPSATRRDRLRRHDGPCHRQACASCPRSRA